MTDLVPFSSGLGLTRVERRTVKEIALARAASSVVAAREAAKVEAIAEVAQTALIGAYDVTGLERALVARTPAFADRAAYLTDRAVVGMGGVLTGMSRRI
jgi:plasmid replication initiation protein